jgi:hypothetical protein
VFVADRFGCDLDAVEATARQLGQVLDELEHFDSRDDSHAGDLASGRIQSALHSFYEDSSDQRKKVTDSVKGLRDILDGLADGVRQLDQGLADALPDQP